MEDLLHVDPLELEIGFRLIGLADPTRGGDLLDRLKTVRQRVARDLGLIVPQVRIHDEIGLPPNEYRVKIRGTQVGQGIAYAGRLLAVPPAGLVTRPDGRDGVDPVTGQPAVWIHADGREVAELAGCRVLEASAVVAGHFGEIVADHADELMTREQVERLLERVRSTAPTLVDEVVPGLLRAGELQRVLQNLLRERVSIRDLETILETLAVARRADQGHRATDRAGAAEPRPADHRDVPRGRRPAPRRHAGSRPRRPAGRRRQPGRDPARRGARRRHGPEHHPRRRRRRRHPDRERLSPRDPHLGRGPAVLKDLTRADLPRLVVLSQREIPRDTPVEVLGSVVEEKRSPRP